MNSLFDMFITIIILVGLIFLGYIIITKKTITEIWEEIKDILSPTEIDIR